MEHSLQIGNSIPLHAYNPVTACDNVARHLPCMAPLETDPRQQQTILMACYGDYHQSSSI